MKSNRNSEVDLKNITAVIFDTDGVLTNTTSIHAQAWKLLFDEYLKERAERHHTAMLMGNHAMMGSRVFWIPAVSRFRRAVPLTAPAWKPYVGSATVKIVFSWNV